MIAEHTFLTTLDNKSLKHSSLLRKHSHDTSCDRITMSLDNNQSVSSIEGNVKPKMEHLDSEVQRKLINNLDDILSKQERPAGQDEYVRPSVIVWNPMAMRRQTTFTQNLQDTGVATGTYFRPV
ncbi:hypothetical protein QTP88_001570 [Uroleucon formosanum]